MRFRIEQVLDEYNGDEEMTLIHGDCRGLDRLAAEVANDLGWWVQAFPAEWKRYRSGAGPRRNRQMLTEGKPDLVLAFHDNLSVSKGTANMVSLALKAALPVRLFQSTTSTRPPRRPGFYRWRGSKWELTDDVHLPGDMWIDLTGRASYWTGDRWFSEEG